MFFLNIRGKVMVLVPSIDIYQPPSMLLNIQTTEVEFTKRVVVTSPPMSQSNADLHVVLFVINKVISPYLFHGVSYINAH